MSFENDDIPTQPLPTQPSEPRSEEPPKSPHDPPPNEAYVTYQRVVKDAMIDAATELRPMFPELIQQSVTELRPMLAELLNELVERLKPIDEYADEPDIAYQHRHHWMKIVVVLLVPFVVVFAASTLFVLLSSNMAATLLGVILLWGGATSSYIAISRKTSSRPMNTPLSPAHRAMKGAWTVGILIVVLLFAIVLGIAEVDPVITYIYIALSLIVMFFSAREYYKWSELWIYKSGGTLIALRPGRRLFLLPAFQQNLPLRQVTNSALETSIVGIWLKYDHVMINAADDEDLYWNNLHFIIEGQRLLAAVNQGKQRY